MPRDFTNGRSSLIIYFRYIDLAFRLSFLKINDTIFCFWSKTNLDRAIYNTFLPLKVVTNEKGEAVGEVLTIIC